MKMKNAHCMVSRRSVIAAAAACALGLFFEPKIVMADSLPHSGDPSSRFSFVDYELGVIVKDAVAGEWVRTVGDISGNNTEMLLVYDSGSTSTVHRDNDGDVFIDGAFFIHIEETEIASTRTCVEMKRERYHIDPNVTNLLSIVASLVSLGLSAPYSVLVNIATILMGVSGLNRLSYLETISYYCDTPSPRMRYVTNYYYDAAYSDFAFSQTSETVFQNP